MRISPQVTAAQALTTQAPTARRTLVSQRAALSVAAAAVVGGALFVPSAAAQPAGPLAQQSVVAGCGDCYPDVI
ncbi:hypothetical protein [Streptomyces sp. NPDC051561]|uniref:hypothetical protein n=1 Tax=Streptomyces sp. NPDC051561 TaxID=3365658 RepID=UPI0037AAB805